MLAISPILTEKQYHSRILMFNPSTISLIKKGKSPKGDIIEGAEISATMAKEHGT